MSRQWSSYWLCWVSVFCTACVVVLTPKTAQGSELPLVVPNALATTEGVGAGGWPERLRAQYIYSGNQFGGLPEAGGFLTTIRFRPDGATLFPANWSTDELAISASVTMTAPAAMSANFDANITAPVTLVRENSPWQGGTQNLGPIGGPKVFDIEFVLDTPFHYNPMDGNLMLDFLAQGPVAAPISMDRLADFDRSDAAVMVAWDWSHGSPPPSTAQAYVGATAMELEFFSAAVDFDADHDCDLNDLNALLSQGPLAAGVLVEPGINDRFDLTTDGVLDNSDVDAWLSDAAAINGFRSPYLRGDSDLNGWVDGSDFIRWNSGKFSSSLLWDRGDFNGDGIVDGGDFIVWNSNKFMSSQQSSGQVPEPNGLVVVLAMTALMIVRGRPRI